MRYIINKEKVFEPIEIKIKIENFTDLQTFYTALTIGLDKLYTKDVFVNDLNIDQFSALIEELQENLQK